KTRMTIPSTPAGGNVGAPGRISRCSYIPTRPAVGSDSSPSTPHEPDLTAVSTPGSSRPARPRSARAACLGDVRLGGFGRADHDHGRRLSHLLQTGGGGRSA